MKVLISLLTIIEGALGFYIFTSAAVATPSKWLRLICILLGASFFVFGVTAGFNLLEDYL
jgi:hypothetical protein